MTFEEWLKTRQDARTWSEDEKAVAELVWREAQKHCECKTKTEDKNG
jgi:hypothetical protein